MVAHAYAVQYPESTASVCAGEFPTLGSKLYHERKASTQFWHFVWHSIPDLPEALINTPSAVRIYQKHFFDRLCQNPAAFTPHDMEVYAIAYSAAGGMRCGLNVYRAFERDAKMNVKWRDEKGKCAVPYLALWGDCSFADEENGKEMVGEFFETVEYANVENCGHWIAEENPRGFIDAVLGWVGRHGG